MKRARLLSALAVTSLVSLAPTSTAIASSQSKLKIQVAPLDCQLNTVDNGTGQTQYLSPAECNETVTPPSPSSEPTPPDDPPLLIDSLLDAFPASPGLLQEFNDDVPDTTTSSAPKPTINLSNLTEYSTGGVQVSLSKGQVVHFSVSAEETLEQHSVTIKAIGTDFVVLTIASTPFTTTLYIGNINQYDVTGDGVADIEVTLRSIKNGVANLSFRQLSSQARIQTAPFNQPIPSNSKWPHVVGGTSVFSICFLYYKKGYLPKPLKRRK